jgi:hypothetical protein
MSAAGATPPAPGDGPGPPSAAASAFAEALAGAARRGLPEPAPDPRAAEAFALGWQIAVLYRPEQRRVATPAAEADLPSIGRLSEAQIIGLGLDRVQVAVHGLHGKLSDAGLDPPDITGLRSQIVATTTPEDRRDLVRTLHLQLNSVLGAADFRLGKAYGLGRAIADTCRNPGSLADLRAELADARMATLVSWLDDLSSAFPPHAGHSVRESLRAWHAWATTATDPAPDEVWALLRRQGDLWRALLSGEKLGTDMLEIDNYLDAAERLLARTRALVWRFVRRFPVLVALVVALFAGGVALIVIGSSSASVVAGLGSVLAAVGLTWRGVGGTVGNVVAGLERPLWGAELDKAITGAITLLPGEPDHDETGGRRQLARAMFLQGP